MSIFGLTFIELLGYFYLGVLSNNLATLITRHPWWKRGPGKGGTAKEVQTTWNEVMNHWDEWAGDEEPEEPEPEERYYLNYKEPRRYPAWVGDGDESNWY